jgi:hypothetical protein
MGHEAGTSRKRESTHYQGKDGKQYVAVAATDTLVVYALP